MTGIFCPRCKGDMVKRHSARGPFWGCRTFPACRGTLNVTADGGSDGTTAGIDPTEFPLPAAAGSPRSSSRGPQISSARASCPRTS